jgi:hypothetical protein
VLCFVQEYEYQCKKKDKSIGDNFVPETGAFLTTAKASFTELDDSWKEMKTRVGFEILQSLLELYLDC